MKGISKEKLMNIKNALLKLKRGSFFIEIKIGGEVFTFKNPQEFSYMATILGMMTTFWEVKTS